MPKKSTLTDEQKRLRNREYNRRWRLRHPGVANEIARRSHKKNRAKQTATTREWRRRNPEKVRAMEARKYLKRRNVIRAQRFGITVAEVEKWLEIGKCEACEVPFAQGDGYIDHDHATGRIRGLLCKSCNLALGIIAECPKRLDGLAKYAREKCIVPQVAEAILRSILETPST